MKTLLIDIMWCHLRALGLFAQPRDSLSASQIRAGVLPMYTPWLNESVRIFEQRGYLRRQDDDIVLMSPPDMQIELLWAQWEHEKSRWLDNRDLSAQMVLMDMTLRMLPLVLTGRKMATQIIFPDSSVALVENIYKHNPMADYFNQALADRVAAHVALRAAEVPAAPLRIIEIGAGTGATSAVVLAKLVGLHHGVQEYCYTDLSKAFLNHAEKTYGSANPFLSYRILNIEKSLPDQGFEVGGFDVVIAANVLHATRNIRTTLRQAKALLKPDGLIFLNELTTNSLFNHLTFGLLEGWWLYEDGALRIPGSPGLLPEAWRHVLELEGFRNLAFPCLEAMDLGQQIILAESDGVIRLLAESAPHAEPAPGAVAASRVEPAASGPTVPVSARADVAVAPSQPARADRRKIERVLLECLAAAVRIDKDRLRSDEPFSSYGLDSIIAVNLTRAINDVLALDLDITVLFEHNTLDALLAHALANQAPAPAEASAAIPVAAAPAAQRATVELDRTLLQTLSDALRIDQTRIDPLEPFSSYGLDSIIAVNVTRLINQTLGIDLEITVMFEHGSLRQLSDFIAAQHPDLSAPAASNDHLPGSPVNAVPTQAPAWSAAPPADARRASRSQVQTPPQPPSHQEGFAIIGMHGRFPGANDIHAFWETIRDGRRCISTPPLDRVDWQAYAQAGSASALDGLWGGFLEGVHEFDALFFGIAPAEAVQMSPEQRLLLLSAWNALEDAGYTPKTLAAAPTGVFIATGPSEYVPARRPGDDSSSLLATPSLSLIPNRISYLLNLQGPSEFCETTCSSSLVALHRAVQSMRLGECEQAIVGGINLILSPAGYAGMASVDMLSRDGCVQPFQQAASGTVRSEGVCTMLIKPLGKALEDGDFIYAVVKGTAVAHGGKGVSLTAPNVQGMKIAMQQAYRQAGVHPATVSYIEAHGMATVLADSAEIAAFKSAWHVLSQAAPVDAAPSQTVYIGTLKPCIGHAEVVSGMAALVKVTQAMRHRTMPGIAGFTGLHEAISLTGSPLAMAVENMPWHALSGADGQQLPRRASINSYGIGGVNAHAVIEAHEPVFDARDEEDGAQHIVVLSAKDPDSLLARATALLAYMQNPPTARLADIAHTLQIGREPMECRWAAVVHTGSALISTLNDYIHASGDAGGEPVAARAYFTGTEADRSAELAEIFSGSIGNTVTRALFAEQRLEDIAQYWVKGAAIDWAATDRGRRARKVPLPAYPFKPIVVWHGQDVAATTLSATSKRSPASVDPASVDLGAETRIQEIMIAVLGLSAHEWNVDRVLSDYGLNSLLLITMLGNIRSHYPGFQADWIKPGSTAREVIRRLADLDSAAPVPQNVVRLGPTFPELIHLNDKTQGQPVFWIHGALGSVETYQAIADRSDRPFYAIQARGFMTQHAPLIGVQAMAGYYLEAVRSVQPEGPYDIGGFCLGGIIAYEMTRQLQETGHDVTTLVMVDSPDNTAFQAAAPQNISMKNAALQVANTLLWPAGRHDLATVTMRMIPREDIDADLPDEDFINRLAELAVERGLGMRRERIETFIKQNMAVQVSYRLHEFRIQPLPRPAVVQCHYFRNRQGLFYGELSRYFTTSEEGFSLDNVVYWQDWQRELDHFNMVDIEASNHMTILFEERSLEVIMRTCEHLYGSATLQTRACP